MNPKKFLAVQTAQKFAHKDAQRSTTVQVMMVLEIMEHQ